MKCVKCGHADRNPMGKCMEEIVETNVKITGLDGKEYIEPVLHDICACTDPIHYENAPPSTWRVKCE